MNGKAKPVYADIEIYLLSKGLSDIVEWLKKRFVLLLPDTEAKGNSTTHHLLAKTDTATIRIIIVEKVLDGYSSVLFDSPNTPWESDLDCARDAFRHLRVEVRCCAGSWSPEQNPDEWLSICQEGESVITW
ncbi:MAG: hypothetical protein QGI68_11640 [Pseudomonadales bacterium]|jgi:hypothetical protein|nr:hypothetical protein [Pseudomonadales bacterium]MDP7144136.1 hypothetical protein [Pseudomonadales bacterium]MDP7357758.1 hypothetical protein [Pseudomonadales bacterium]MDP7596203.1 hypothetical protein [Pseudomonadales bacterium]HJN50461.1 hypothetical protein [Pseudomonadales bacterium]|tara:strand:+ start:1316 stop:1708 length:393 start_codon:yes stop_codon:yes gene_type:complete